MIYFLIFLANGTLKYCRKFKLDRNWEWSATFAFSIEAPSCNGVQGDESFFQL